jgi:hypothetical protein
MSKQVVAGPRRRVGERGSWYHFLTNSFHGVLGISSLLVTLSAWIHTEYAGHENMRSASSLILPILSVIFTTILSIHSSFFMLEKSPHQSTILDYNLKYRQGCDEGAYSEKTCRSINIKVVAPHRDAFHRTSIIMQYANSRILLLMERRYRQVSLLSAESISLSSVMLWGLVTYMCLRMLPTSSVTKIIFPTEQKVQTNSSETSDKTVRKLPGFWVNGNTYCFVLPMMMSVLADFCMTTWCEYHYFNDHPSSSYSLFQYHSQHWLSLWHLFFLQVVAHMIAFSFTLAFRIKHSNRNRKNGNDGYQNSGKLEDVNFFQYIKVTQLLNIRTLYWTCTIGVYAIVSAGLMKAIATINALGK